MTLGSEFLKLLYISEPLIITNTGDAEEAAEVGLTLMTKAAIGAAMLLFLIFLSIMIGCCVVSQRRKNAAPHTRYSPHPSTIHSMLRGYQKSATEGKTPKALNPDEEEESLFCKVNGIFRSHSPKKQREGAYDDEEVDAEQVGDDDVAQDGAEEEEKKEAAVEETGEQEEAAAEEEKEAAVEEEEQEGKAEEETVAAEEPAADAEAAVSAVDKKEEGGGD